MTTLFPQVSSRGKGGVAHTFKTTYPMYVIPVKTLMEMTEFLPHHEMQRQGFLTAYTPELQGRVLGVSHQWLSYTSPDPEGVHLQTLQRNLERLMTGEIKVIEDFWLQALMFNSSGLKCNGKAALPGMYIWIDYCCIPQVAAGAESTLWEAAGHAITSIPAYMERCSLLVVLAPPCKHKDTGSVCNYATWRGRGWCRAELMCCILAPEDIRVMVCTGVGAMPFLVHPSDGPRLTVGEGHFSCCQLGHECQGQQIPCDKEKVHSVLRTMLEAKLLLLRRRGHSVERLFWSSLRSAFFRGLPELVEGGSLEALPVVPALAEMLAKERAFEERVKARCSAATALRTRLSWGKEEDAVAQRSGFTLVLCAALADDTEAIRELTSGSSLADLNVSLQQDHPHLAYMWKGVCPLGVAMAYGGTDTLQALVDARADPHRTTSKGVDFLMMAACRGQPANVEWWLRQFPSWDLERTENLVGLTVSGIASLSGVNKTPILDSLIQARANLNRHDAWGREGVLPSLVAINEDSDSKAMQALLEHGLSPNMPWRPHSVKWSMMLRGITMAHQCSRSRVFLELAIIRGSTPLHFAAKRGDVDLCKELLRARATPQKNHSGHTPLDVARKFFGDHVPKLLETVLS